jgi:pimeloyl-ACP methyl ester carboxylesterase
LRITGRRFDLDHLGTEVGHDRPGGGDERPRRNFEYPDTFKWLRHVRSPRIGGRLRGPTWSVHILTQVSATVASDMGDEDRPTIVFIHGGQHTGACWQPTIEAIAKADSSVATLAVDLPGRANEPGDLATLTIEQCVDSVVSQIERAGAERVMLVGHSMAGITLPGVLTALGSDRVSRMVYIACCVPPQGATVLSTLKPPVSWFAALAARGNKPSKPLPAPVATWMFANGMTTEQKQHVVAGLCAESASVTKQPVDRSGMPDVPTTWILTLRDNSLKPKLQRQFASNLGNVDEVVEIDACHNAMMSEPDGLARLLLARL